MTGRWNSAATSRKMWMLSASSICKWLILQAIDRFYHKSALLSIDNMVFARGSIGATLVPGGLSQAHVPHIDKVLDELPYIGSSLPTAVLVHRMLTESRDRSFPAKD